MALLYSVHDRDGHAIVPAGGYCVDAVLVTDEPPNYGAIRSDINWIVRLNHGWYPNGTIPLRPDYPAFAKRCAAFAARCPAVNVFIVANEPNHRQEWPGGDTIEPEDYADCFNLCYQAITYERPDAEVLTAAVAPWDNTSGIDWLSYYKQMLAAIVDCDGLAVHGYTHGADPNLIWSMEKQHGWYWHFPVIYQTIQAIPPKFATRPVHVTETDQGDDAWLDGNTGWVQNAYQSVNEHNMTPGTQKVCSLALYRWRGDKYELHNKDGVQDDFSDAVRHGYISPLPELPEPPRPTPPNPQPEPPRPTPPPPEPTRDIDPRLIARGVHFDFAKPPEGVGYWRITSATWLDEAEADAVGPDHHILGTIKRAQQEVAGVLMLVSWPSGSGRVISKADQAYATYNWDFPMSASLNEFSIKVDDGAPSDAAHGIGMGKGGNPGIHTSTWIEYEWTISEGITVPVPPFPPRPEPAGDLTHPLPGSVITQHWGENAANYARFGIWGHNGTDLGGRPSRTPVRCLAAGIVAYSDFDAAYGHYVRVDHPQLGCYSMYCHLDEPGALEGIRLEAGATVGLLGTSGNSSGVHLHLEIRLHNADGTYREDCPMPKGRVDPQTWAILLGLKL
jgi:murein DD-endopeptidase MepM/ murein hydrolase activator NlpD